MNKLTVAPVKRRFKDQPGDQSVDGRVGALFRRLPDAEPLPPAALARVEARLARGPQAWARPRAFRWAVAALVLGSSGTVLARKEIVTWLARATTGTHRRVPPAASRPPRSPSAPRQDLER